MIKKTITLIITYLLVFVFIKIAISRYLSAWYHHKQFWYFFGAFLVALVIFKKYLNANSFYSTLRHELCHWFFALLSFSKPHSLRINGDGSGSYQHFGRHNYGIVLAPYFFPIVTVFLLLFQVFFNRPSFMYFILLGVALAFDGVSMKKDYHFQQTDWQVYGIRFSIQFSILVAILFLVSILVILFGGFDAYTLFLKRGYYFAKGLFV